MTKNTLLTSVVISCMLILTACSDPKEVTYEIGGPDEESPAYMKFISDAASDHKRILDREDEATLYTRGSTDYKNNVQYYKRTDQDLKDYFHKVVNEGLTYEAFEKLRFDDTGKNIETLENREKHHFPDVELEQDNVLHIATTEGKERRFKLTELLEAYDVTPTEDISVKLFAVTDQAMQLEIESFDGRDSGGLDVALFIKQDLSDVVVTSLENDAFAETMKDEDMEDYLELFTNVDDSIYLLKTVYGYKIWNSQANELETIDDADRLSEDGRHVYLGGDADPISDENIQQIQSLEDYLAESDTIETEFSISFKQIGKELDLKTSGVSVASTKYFIEDYIVLRLNYKGKIVGDAGATNVMIYLQDQDNPTAYIVDLSWV